MTLPLHDLLFPFTIYRRCGITQPAHHTALAGPPPVRTLIPIGSDYRPDTLGRFALAAAQRDTSGVVDLLVLPITYASDAQEIKQSERDENMTTMVNQSIMTG